MLKITWTATTGTQEQKPLAVDAQSSPNRVYLRRNITRAQRTLESGETVREWHYEEAELTRPEYAEYEKMLAELESPAMEKIREENTDMMAAIAEIYERAESQQLAIMAALADIYETSLTV